MVWSEFGACQHGKPSPPIPSTQARSDAGLLSKTRHTAQPATAAAGAVKAVSVTMQGDHVLSCSTDATVRLWRIPLPGAEQEPAAAAAAQFLGKNAFLAVDCHWSRNAFATAGSQARSSLAPGHRATALAHCALRTARLLGGCSLLHPAPAGWLPAARAPDGAAAAAGAWCTCRAAWGVQLEVWDLSRSAPLSRFQWGVDTLQTVRFNPAEPDLLASTASDRSLVLYDLRSSTPIRKLVMQARPVLAAHAAAPAGHASAGPARCPGAAVSRGCLQTRSNSVAWNPMEAFNLTLANEDCSLYTYDIRKLKSAACVHQVCSSSWAVHT